MNNKEEFTRATDSQTGVLLTFSQNSRLLSMEQAAEYVGLSYWTIRDYVAASILPTVKLPCAQRRAKGGKIMRKAGDISARRILIDRRDLDELIERSKEVA